MIAHFVLQCVGRKEVGTITNNSYYCSGYKKTEKKIRRTYLKGHQQAKHSSFKNGLYRCDFDNKFFK